MSILVHETFDDGWEKSWSGQIKNAYKSGDALRLMFRNGDHYGCALHQCEKKQHAARAKHQPSGFCSELQAGRSMGWWQARSPLSRHWL